MAITVTKRSTKGSALTHAEMDDNLQQLADLSSTATDDGTKGFNLVYYPPKTGEVGVVNYQYTYGHVCRHGNNTIPGTTDMTSAIINAIVSAKAIGCDVNLTPNTRHLITKTGSYTANGVTRNYGIELLEGVQINANGAILEYESTTADTVLNQFEFITNKAVNSTFEGYYVNNIKFKNTGVVDTYVNGLSIFGGDGTKNIGWLSDIYINNIHSENMRSTVFFHTTRTDGNSPTVNAVVENIRANNCSSVVVNISYVDSVSVDNVVCNQSNFDIITVFAGKGISISNVIGKAISENVVLISPQATNETISDIQLSNIRSDTGKLTIAANIASNTVDGVQGSNIVTPVLNVGGTGLGSVLNININGLTLNGDISRSLYISNASDVSIDQLSIKGTHTISGAEVNDSDRITLNGVINESGPFPCLILNRARNMSGDLRLLNGTNGVYLVGISGSMGGVELHVDCSGQSSNAVDYDGNSSTSHKVHIWGRYGGSGLNYANVTGSLIELEDGSGANLTPVSGVIAALTNKIHFVVSETGTADNLDAITAGLPGQEVTIFAINGHVITVRHAANGGNIRTLTGASVAVGFITPILLKSNGTHWVQV